MGEFFKSWRRKVGLFSLVMACVFTCLWMRSSLNKDDFEFEWSASFVTIASNQYGLWWVMSELPGRLYQPSKLSGKSRYWSLPGQRQPFSADPFRHLIHGGWTTEWKRSWGGFHTGHYRNEDPMAGICLTIRIIPHWIVVWPFILLTAYFLLATRRPLPLKRIKAVPASCDELLTSGNAV